MADVGKWECLSRVRSFILTDEENREFVAQRYCFRGSIDDWIEIDGPDLLENLVKRFVQHLGQQSFYDLPLM